MKESRPRRRDQRVVWGSILVALGVVFLIQEVFHIEVTRLLWPLILIALGIGVILGRR